MSPLNLDGHKIDSFNFDILILIKLFIKNYKKYISYGIERTTKRLRENFKRENRLA